MIAQSASPEEVLDQFKTSRLRALSDRESVAQEQRQRLRESVVQLREPSPRPASAPASTSQPTFKIGDAKDFPFVSEHGATTPGNGHLSPKNADEFFSLLKDAAVKPDVASRDTYVGKAANVVARDWATKHGLTGREVKDGLLHSALQEARAQATFVARELGGKIGVGPVESSLIGYSLERALEREGFKVLANHAIDKTSALFSATSASIASTSGLRNAAESTLSKSMNWLSAHGVTRDGLKDALGKHAGKLLVISEVSRHPEIVKQVAVTLSQSDKLMDGVILLAKDDELRKAVGSLTLATGESIAGIHKGAGSVAILAGSALRGDSAEDTARHAFRAALTVLGGAAGGVAGAGVASVATGTAGAVAGGWVADKLLDLYDKHLGGKEAQTPAHVVSKEETANSTKVIADRVATRMKSAGQDMAAEKLPSSVMDRGRELEREYSMNKPAPGNSNS